MLLTAYRVLLRGPGADLEGGSQQQPHQVVENLEIQQDAS